VDCFFRPACIAIFVPKIAFLRVSCAEFLRSFAVQGKKIPMTSGKDLVRLLKRLKKREQKQGNVGKNTILAAAGGEAAVPVEEVVGGAVEIAPVPGVSSDAVGDGCFTKASASGSHMMPPPMLPMASSKYNSMISKKLCEITQFPGFAKKSHLSVGFRQRDEKVSVPDLMVVSGKYNLVSEAHDAILKMVEIKDPVLNDLDSLEIDDNLMMLRGKSVILMAFPDAIEFLHRLGVCTIDKDDIVPPIEAEVAVASDAVQGAIMGQDVVPAAASDVIHQVQVSVASGVAMCAVQNVNVPPIAVSVMSPSIAAKIRMHTVPASVLKTFPALQNLPDSCLDGFELRQIDEGEVDENGQDIGGWFVMVDVAAVLLYKDAANARKFARNPRIINKESLTSLTWVDSGNNNVSNILFKYYFLDNFLGTRGIEKNSEVLWIFSSERVSRQRSSMTSGFFPVKESHVRGPR